MDGHLVAVEVGVERCADERVQTDGLALDEDGVERLDTEAVERRGAVQHHGMALDDLVQDVPDLGAALLNPLAGVADGVDVAALLQAAHDERLEEHLRHLLGQAALVDV